MTAAVSRVSVPRSSNNFVRSRDANWASRVEARPSLSLLLSSDSSPNLPPLFHTTLTDANPMPRSALPSRFSEMRPRAVVRGKRTVGGGDAG